MSILVLTTKTANTKESTTTRKTVNNLVKYFIDNPTETNTRLTDDKGTIFMLRQDIATPKRKLCLELDTCLARVKDSDESVHVFPQGLAKNFVHTKVALKSAISSQEIPANTQMFCIARTFSDCGKKEHFVLTGLYEEDKIVLASADDFTVDTTCSLDETGLEFEFYDFHSKQYVILASDQKAISSQTIHAGSRLYCIGKVSVFFEKEHKIAKRYLLTDGLETLFCDRDDFVTANDIIHWSDDILCTKNKTVHCTEYKS